MSPETQSDARTIHSGEHSALTSADPDNDIQVLVEALKQAVRTSSAGPDASGPNASPACVEEPVGPLEQVLQDIQHRLPLKEFEFPSRLPIIGGLIAFVQEQLGRLGSKYHTRNLLNQQNEINSALLATVRQVARSLEEERAQRRLLAQRVEHDLDSAVAQARQLTKIMNSLGEESRAVRNHVTSRLGTIEADLNHRLQDRDARSGERLETFESEITRLLETQEAEFGVRLRGVEDVVNTQLLALRASPELQDRVQAALKEIEQRLHALENNIESGDRLDHGEQLAPAVVRTDSGFNYFSFELKYRGTPRLVRERQRAYVDVFRGATNVLDIGCGRGEFLELLAAEGVSAHGVDLDAQMVGYCRALDLPVDQVDALSFLETLPDGSLGGVFAAQVLEHLDLSYTLRLLRACHQKMRTGAPILLETPNPLCLGIFAHSFYQDPTHIKPVHPATLQFLLGQTGFMDLELRFTSAIAESEHLRSVPVDDSITATVREAFNENVAKLNSLLFGAQDYAIIARKFVWVPKPDATLTADGNIS